MAIVRTTEGGTTRPDATTVAITVTLTVENAGDIIIAGVGTRSLNTSVTINSTNVIDIIGTTIAGVGMAGRIGYLIPDTTGSKIIRARDQDVGGTLDMLVAAVYTGIDGTDPIGTTALTTIAAGATSIATTFVTSGNDVPIAIAGGFRTTIMTTGSATTNVVKKTMGTSQHLILADKTTANVSTASFRWIFDAGGTGFSVFLGGFSLNSSVAATAINNTQVIMMGKDHSYKDNPGYMMSKPTIQNGVYQPEYG